MSGLVCLFLAASAGAAWADGLALADWTAVSSNVAAGTLLGNSITLSGTHVFDPPTSDIDGQPGLWTEGFYTPTPPAGTDGIQIAGYDGDTYTLAFGAPVTDPTIHIFSLASRLDFPAGTLISRLSGQPAFTVAGASIAGDGAADQSGSVQLIGTFTSITFTATRLYAATAEDGIVVEVGATAPPATTPTEPSTLPVIAALAPTSAPAAAGRATVVAAAVTGNATGIAWDLDGDGKPEIVGSATQTSLRFRARAGTTVVTAVPIGPDGTGAPVSTMLAVAPGRTTAKAPRKFLRKLRSAPRVYAVGPAESFAPHPTGFRCTGDVTVRAGWLEVTGCLRPVTSLADIPDREKAALLTVTHFIGLRGSRLPPAPDLDLLDGYISTGRSRVSVNGLSLTPVPGAAVLVYPQVDLVASSGADASIGGIRLGIPVSGNNRFRLNTALAHGAIPVGSFLRAGGVSSLAGFALAGTTVDVTLLPADGYTPAAARVTTSLRLPAFLQLGGGDANGPVTLLATTRDGLLLDHLRIGPLGASIGGLALQGLRLDYRRDGDVWQGQGRVCLPGGNCLDMIPPNGGVEIAGGAFRKAGATLSFNPSVPLFPGVGLRHIGFTLALDPTRFIANAGITAAGNYQVDGAMLVAFPSARTPFVLRPDEVGGFPSTLYGTSHTGLTIAANGQASLDVPVVGRVALANGYFLYEHPGAVSFGGGVDEDFAGVFRLIGTVTGDFNAGNGAFNLLGRVDACLTAVFCRGGDGFLSSAGAAACIHLGPLSFGAGLHYRPFSVEAWPFDGCKWSPFRDRRSGRAAARAGAPYLVDIKAGATSRAIRLEGADGAPVVRVTGPGGQSLTSTPDTVFDHAGALRILRLPSSHVTTVGLQDPRPGTYRIETEPGSSTVTRTSEAADQPAAKLLVRVRSTGTRVRTLTYRVRRRLAQTVTFSELTASGSMRTIGSVKGGGQGSLRFVPSAGGGTSHVVAQFALDGLSAERLTVASFSPPSPRLTGVQGLRVGRRGTTLTTRWRPVPGATRYEVVVSVANGAQRLLRPRAHAIVIRHVPASSAGRVTVIATDGQRIGPRAARRFRATTPLRTRFSNLPRGSTPGRRPGR